MTAMPKLPEAPETDAAGLREEYDLPELAETYEEAEARAAANRYLLALRRVQRERATAKAELKATIEDLEYRSEQRDAQLAKSEGWLLDQLRQLARFFTFAGKKSLKLLAGRVGYRQAREAWEIADPERLLDWAQQFAQHLVSTPPVKPRVLVSDFTTWADAAPADTLRWLQEQGIVGHRTAADEFYAKPAEPEQ